VKRLIPGIVVATLALACMLAYANNRRETAYRELIAQGDRALTQADSFAAVEAFSVAIALKPDSMLGYLKRGEAYRQYGEFETALKDLRTASRLDPSATRPLELLGDVEQSLGRYDRATTRYEQYIRIDDRSPRVLYKLALSKLHAGNVSGALDALKGAIKIDEGSAQAHYLMALCFDAQKKPEQAKASLHRAVELSPGLLDARERLAELHRQTADLEDEIIQLEGLRTLDPGSASRHVSLGLALADAGQLDRAVAILGAAAERFPTHAYTFVALGRVWLDVAQTRDDPVQLQKAMEALERGAAVDASSEALMLLGRALMLDGKLQRAATVLAEAAAKKPVEPMAYSYLADVAEQIGNATMARDALLDLHALEGDPPDGRRRGHLFQRVAELSVQIGDVRTAVGWFERAAAADATRVDAAFLVRLADAQWRSGDTAGARASATRALEREPDDRAARALLGKMKSR
jgi:tetratricopeptide (TPR) repeat protein